jgi:hypothetical protein
LGDGFWEDHGWRSFQLKKFIRSHLNGWVVTTVVAAITPVIQLPRKHKSEDFGAGQPGNKVRLYLENNQCKKGWQSRSSDRVSAYQTQSPEFKP